jgi:poly-gamma-glutamate capsule biosynthesis protein CapA/YwtB (metallophosphatase superfamily)
VSLATALRVIAVGDLALNGRYHRLLERHGDDYPFRKVAPAWRGADLRLGNLESPLTALPRCNPSKLTLRAAPAAGESLRRAGFDCLALANNHAMDFGPAGLEETQARLASAGIRAVGAGRNSSDAQAPVLLQRNGQKIALLSFCAVEQHSPLYAGPHVPGVACFDLQEATARIRHLRREADWLIVQLHWGHELAELPSPQQRSQARALVEAGADLILGHHPHVWQPLECIAGVPVLYSLGNFVFSDMYWRGIGAHETPFVGRFRLHPLSRQTGWAEVLLERGRPARVVFHPARLRRNLSLAPRTRMPAGCHWEHQGHCLVEPNYEDVYEAERARAAARLHWQSAWRSLPRRLGLLLYRCGLVPGAVEEI